MVRTAGIYFIQFGFCPPQLHQHLHPHSICHPKWQNLFTNCRYALAPISTLVWPVLVTGFERPLQINDFITLYMLPFISLHFLCTINLVASKRQGCQVTASLNMSMYCHKTLGNDIWFVRLCIWHELALNAISSCLMPCSLKILKNASVNYLNKKYSEIH